MAELSEPMAPATDTMPEDERMVRNFLARYRAPGPPGAAWTEAHVARLLQRIRRERNWSGRHG